MSRDSAVVHAQSHDYCPISHELSCIRNCIRASTPVHRLIKDKGNHGFLSSLGPLRNHFLSTILYLQIDAHFK